MGAFLGAGLLAMAATGAQANIITLAQYNLGENDPGAVAGAASTGTYDSSGNGHDLLTVVGPVIYSSDAAPAPGGSTMSVLLNGSNGVGGNPGLAGLSGPLVNTLTENFGIEAWVKPTLAYLGKTRAGVDRYGFLLGTVAVNGTGCCSGYGLSTVTDDISLPFGYYSGLYSGLTYIPGAPIGIPGPPLPDWTHVALVNLDGITNLYINGALVFSQNINDPLPPDLPLCCDVNSMSIAGDGFHGLIDNLRLFTFNKGEFRASDLDVAVPEPMTLGFFGAGLVGVIGLRRRKKQA